MEKQLPEQPSVAVITSIISRYPHADIVATYLPMNTGANGWTNSSINAIAPFLVKEDVICYLDDDNRYTPEHVATGIATLKNTACDFAYSLRNLCDDEGKFICQDSIESIGFYTTKFEYPVSVPFEFEGKTYKYDVTINRPQHIDTNCFFFPRPLAATLSPVWHSGIHNDNNVFKHLREHGYQGTCSKHFSVNYRFDPGRYFSKVPPDARPVDKATAATPFRHQVIQYINRLNLQNHGGVWPWE